MADSKKYDGSQWEHSLRKLTTATEAVENPLYSDGTAITAYTIKGNTVQSGTPTPSNPVSVNGVGERTANLFDKSTATITTLYGSSVTNHPIYESNPVLSVVLQCEPNTTYTLQKIVSNRFIVWTTTNYPVTGDSWNTQISTEATNTTLTFTTGASDYYLIFMLSYDSSEPSTQDILDSIMYNYGPSALPYEPWGYKIPISSGQQTIDIYIGDLPLLKSLDSTAVDEINNGTLTRRVDSDGSVLPTPTTTQITMPSIPTTDGANSITVDTTVQPSEFTATWTGWHNAEVKEKSENLWNEEYPDLSSTAIYVPLNVGEGNFTLSTNFQAINNTTDIFLLSGNVTSGISSSDNGAYAGKNVTKASIGGYVTVAYRKYAQPTTGALPYCEVMLNSGSTALPYEPFWK